MQQVSFYKTFFKAQTAAVIATTVDFVAYLLLVEVVGAWYVAAAGCSAALGALSGFLLGRHWCFYAADGHLTRQGLRYMLVAGASLLLNTLGIYALTELASLHHLLSKVFIAVLVGFFFNFPMHRYYVFRQA